MLVDIAEIPVANVAEILGLREGTVKSRVHRVRLLLRKKLAERLPRRDTPAKPEHSRRVCLDLLKAKQEALDRGAEFPFSNDELCYRCRAVFASLDLAHETCKMIGRGELELPAKLTEELNKMYRSPAASN